MIPKIIHYCWFGENEKPADVVRCIESWKKYFPDYQIYEWNERTYEVNTEVQYVREAYKAKKWAFVSDYVRLFALYNYGGIYLDTDVEVFKSFDDLLNNTSFWGFESKDYVASAVMGCEPRDIIIKEFMESYQNRNFIKEDGSFDTTTNVIELTKILRKYGLKKNGKEQLLNYGIRIYPQDYFASNHFMNVFGKYSKNIYAYHHCLASWYMVERNGGKIELIRHYIVGVLRNIVGTDRLNAIKEKKMRKNSEKNRYNHFS